MQFTRQGNVIKAVHTTGPTHNLLGLELTDSAVQGEFEIEELEIPGPIRLAAADVSREALAGVADANLALGTKFSVLRVQFASSDTGPYEFFRMMAHSIVRYRVEHG